MPIDYEILGKYILSELQSIFARVRLYLGLKILPKGAANLLSLILQKIAEDISKIEESKRDNISAHLNIEIKVKQ